MAHHSADVTASSYTSLSRIVMQVLRVQVVLPQIMLHGVAHNLREVTVLLLIRARADVRLVPKSPHAASHVFFLTCVTGLTARGAIGHIRIELDLVDRLLNSL